MRKHCAVPGCPVIVDRGRCGYHAKQRDSGTRGTAQQRGYDSRWAAVSRIFRQQHPICGERHDYTMDRVHSRCVQQGRTTPAECVDHTIPVAAGGAMFEQHNLMSACLACNTWKANTLERKAVAMR